MEPETIGEPVHEETVTAKNFFSRLGGVFFSPREAFTEIGKAPRLVIPIIALFLVSAFSSWYLAQKIDTRETARIRMEQAVRQGQITEDTMNQQFISHRADSCNCRRRRRAVSLLCNRGLR